MTQTKQCLLCKEVRKLEEFSFRSKLKGTRIGQCKICIRQQIKKHYYAHKKYYLFKARKRNIQIRISIKKYIWNYLEKHPCKDCGEKDPIVLEFDHISDKISEVSAMYRNFTLEAVIKEIQKCEVRCANCHRRKTAAERGWYKNIKPL